MRKLVMSIVEFFKSKKKNNRSILDETNKNSRENSKRTESIRCEKLSSSSSSSVEEDFSKSCDQESRPLISIHDRLVHNPSKVLILDDEDNKVINMCPKTRWIYDYLLSREELFASPAKIGRDYGKSVKNKDYYRASIVRNQLNFLLSVNLVEVNSIGHFRIKQA